MTIQAQYLRLLREIQEETNLALIFITHDFGIVAKMCDRVMVMYAGRVVESGSVRDIFNHPSHPYTQALLNSVPTWTRTWSGSIRSPASRRLWDLPLGCRFAARCPTPTTGAGATIRPRSPWATAIRRLLEAGEPWTPSRSSAPRA